MKDNLDDLQIAPSKEEMSQILNSCAHMLGFEYTNGKKDNYLVRIEKRYRERKGLPPLTDKEIEYLNEEYERHMKFLNEYNKNFKEVKVYTYSDDRGSDF